MSHRARVEWRLIPVAALVAAAVAVDWFYPYPVDALRYGHVDPQCTHRFTFRGEVGGRSISGRHCAGGVVVWLLPLIREAGARQEE